MTDVGRPTPAKVHGPVKLQISFAAIGSMWQSGAAVQMELAPWLCRRHFSSAETASRLNDVTAVTDGASVASAAYFDFSWIGVLARDEPASPYWRIA